MPHKKNLDTGNPIPFELVYASKDYKEIIKNLMQFYVYDFSEYIDCDVEENGLYKAYSNLEDYWKDENYKFPYIISQAGKLVGFSLVDKCKSPENYFSIAEFFIMKKYRRKGVGKGVAKQLFSIYKGDWQVHQRENNIAAQEFWKTVIGEYTSGKFTERLKHGRKIENFTS